MARLTRAWEEAILRVDTRPGPTLGAFLPMVPGEESLDRPDLPARQAMIRASETQAGGRRDERRHASLRASLRRHGGWKMNLREPLREELRGAWLALDDVPHRRQFDSAGICAGVSASARARTLRTYRDEIEAELRRLDDQWCWIPKHISAETAAAEATATASVGGPSDIPQPTENAGAMQIACVAERAAVCPMGLGPGGYRPVHHQWPTGHGSGWMYQYDDCAFSALAAAIRRLAAAALGHERIGATNRTGRQPIDDLLEGIGKQLDGGPESLAAISRRLNDTRRQNATRKRRRAGAGQRGGAATWTVRTGGGRGGGPGAAGGATGGD